MAKIIQESEIIKGTEYFHNFDYHGQINCGFSFPCDKDGNILADNMATVGIDNYNKCINGTFDMVDRGVQSNAYVYREPAVAECEVCESDVALVDAMSNYCDCGAEYNLSGQRVFSELAEEPWDYD